MNIDRTIYKVIADGTATIAEVLAAMTRMLPEIERVALEAVAANAIAAGFADADVRWAVEKHARLLSETRAERIATIRQRLEVGSTYLQ
jgi:hypothetical protein